MLASVQRLISLVLGLILLVGVGGCGVISELGSTPAPDQTSREQATPSSATLAKNLDKAFQEAETVRMTVRFPMSGQTAHLELEGSVNGSFAAGEMSMPGGSVRYRIVEKQLYVTGSGKLAALLAGGKAPARGRWVKAPASPAARTFLNFTVAGLWRDRVLVTAHDLESLNKSSVSTVLLESGPAYRMVVPDRAAKRGVPVMVLADGSWRITQIGDADTSWGMVTFSDWDNIEPVTAPQNA
jgi:hypothetical protein